MVLVCLERLGRPRSNFVLVFYGATGVTSLKFCSSIYGVTGVTSLKCCSSLYGATGVTSLRLWFWFAWSDWGDLAQILF